MRASTHGILEDLTCRGFLEEHYDVGKAYSGPRATLSIAFVGLFGAAFFSQGRGASFIQVNHPGLNVSRSFGPDCFLAHLQADSQAWSEDLRLQRLCMVMRCPESLSLLVERGVVWEISTKVSLQRLHAA